MKEFTTPEGCAGETVKKITLSEEDGHVIIAFQGNVAFWLKSSSTFWGEEVEQDIEYIIPYESEINRNRKLLLLAEVLTQEEFDTFEKKEEELRREKRKEEEERRERFDRELYENLKKKYET